MVNWDFIYLVAAFVQSTWMWCYILRSVLRYLRKSSKTINWIFFEGRPLVPVILVVTYVSGGIADGTNGIGWRLFSLIVGFLNWWFARHEKDDDDRWKKRAAKLASVVAQVGGKLQVVPVGGKS